MKYKCKNNNLRVYVTPEFKKKPDVAKLGRALMALAEKLEADKKAKEEAKRGTNNGDASHA
jgi:hypothetical protein